MVRWTSSRSISIYIRLSAWGVFRTRMALAYPRKLEAHAGKKTMMLRCDPSRFLGALACLAVAGIVGCGGQGTVPVEGRVTLDGRPLPNATVMLSQLKASDPGP